MKQKRKIVVRVFALLLVLAGLAGVFLPQINQLVYQNKADRLLTEYYTRVEEIEKDDMALLLQRIQEYNQQLFESGQELLKDPFAYEQVAFSLVEFGFDEELVGSIMIPKLNLELPIYLGATPENLDKGAAHLSQTSIPIGGNNTNAVISAHRNIATAYMFKKMDKLEVGDKVFVKNFYETLEYEIVETKIILPHEFEEILIQPDKDMVTLLTCHPRGQNTHRYVVYCQRSS